VDCVRARARRVRPLRPQIRAVSQPPIGGSTRCPASSARRERGGWCRSSSSTRSTARAAAASKCPRRRKLADASSSVTSSARSMTSREAPTECVGDRRAAPRSRPPRNTSHSGYAACPWAVRLRSKDHIASTNLRDLLKDGLQSFVAVFEQNSPCPPRSRNGSLPTIRRHSFHSSSASPPSLCRSKTPRSLP
jgi:hypothetical protein